MEALILATLIHNTQLPACSKRFVHLWQLNRERALTVMPKSTCIIQTETGRYRCNAKQGCVR